MTGRPECVLMTADAVGGVWTYALELARGLARDGTRTVLAVMGPAPSPGQRMAALRIPGLEIETAAYRLEWMPGAAHDVRRAGDWLMRLAGDHGAGLVHVNGYAHAALPWPVPTVVVAHSCVLSWWRAVRGEDAPAEYDWYRGAARAGLRAASAVVSPTAAFLAVLRELHDFTRAASVVNNGRDADDFRPAAKQPEILAAGRLWDAAKNVAALDRVAPFLPWPICVAGDSVAPDGGEEARRNVMLLGRLGEGEMRRRLAAAAIYAAPARYEPFGLAVLEAALSGCALVLSDIPTFRELWDDAAVFVDAGDDDALSAALAALIADAPRRARLGEQARDRALAYSPARMLAGTREVYGRVLAGTPARRPLQPAGV